MLRSMVRDPLASRPGGRRALQGLVSLLTVLGACHGSPAGTVPLPTALAHTDAAARPPQAGYRRPAVLFASLAGADGLDLDYLAELERAGIDVDFTDNAGDVTAERLRAFNAVVLFATPDAVGVADRGEPSSPARVQSFVDVVEGYLAAGGGVLLMPEEANFKKQRLSDLTDRWGARIAAERIVEHDPANVAAMPHSSRATRLAFSDQVPPSPVSQGVRGVWYPYEAAYYSVMTSPLVVDDGWQVVWRASRSSVTTPVDLGRAGDAAPGLLQRTAPESSPPLMAIRSRGRGRVALVAEWPEFSVGSGTKWIYDRDVLDRGLAGRPSDFGRLLENTLRWLAAPSLEAGTLGGFVPPPRRLASPNASEAVKAEFRSAPPPYDPAALARAPAPTLKLYRGLVGARTALSSGRGRVADYARAARAARLDFVVFLEEFARMTPDRLATLTAECAAASGRDLLLLPGFSIQSNLGNRLFFFSPHPVWPPDSVLTGPGKSLLYVQQENADGTFRGGATPFPSWVLAAYSTTKGQVGYYDFVDAPHGIRLRDAKLSAMVGLRTYRRGRLVEDLLDDYLTTAASTIAPTPVAIDEVESPDDLVRESKSGHAMTYAQAASLDPATFDGIFQRALRWAHALDAMPVFVSSGPEILAWPDCHRVTTYGAEGFAPERSAVRVPIALASDVGLEDVRIYDGPTLFRRIALHGAKTFEQTFWLDASLQRDLVAVVRDRRGGVAVGFPNRSWEEGSLAPIFCSDHINDCSPQWMAHGPLALRLSDPPLLSRDVAGRIWDGGPPASLGAVGAQDTLPVAIEGGRSTSAERLDSFSLLELADEGAVGVKSVRIDPFDPRLLDVVNYGNTFGPLGGPPPLFDNVQRYRQWAMPPAGPQFTGWAAYGVRTGISPSLFTDVIRFHRDATVTSLRLASLRPVPGATLVVGGAGGRRSVDLAGAKGVEIPVPAGSWFGLYAKGPVNAQLFENRGEALRLRAGETLDVLADFGSRRFRQGDSYAFELSSLAFPFDAPVTSDESFTTYAEYLGQPEGLRIARGTRAPSPGLVDLEPDNGAVEATVPRAENVAPLTLPVRVVGLNARWSSELLQKDGYSPGFYGSGTDRLRALAVDADGMAYVPLAVGRADASTFVAGHPVVADAGGRDLFIEVVCLGGAPPRWHVSVNNPGDRPVETTLRQAMDLPGLRFAERRLAVPPGGYVVLQ